jgi:hypothetical protein
MNDILPYKGWAPTVMIYYLIKGELPKGW